MLFGKDGSVRSRDFAIIGYVDDHGQVKDKNFSYIGYAEGVNRELAAVLFFFNLISLK